MVPKRCEAVGPDSQNSPPGQAHVGQVLDCSVGLHEGNIRNSNSPISID